MCTGLVYVCLVREMFTHSACEVLACSCSRSSFCCKILCIIIHHTSYIIHHTTYIIHHTSYIIHHTSYHTSYIIHHTSYIIHHTSYIIHHTSYIIHHTCRKTSNTTGHSNRVYAVKFKPDTFNVILTAGWDNTVQVRTYIHTNSYFYPLCACFLYVFACQCSLLSLSLSVR